MAARPLPIAARVVAVVAASAAIVATAAVMAAASAAIVVTAVVFLVIVKVALVAAIAAMPVVSAAIMALHITLRQTAVMRMHHAVKAKASAVNALQALKVSVVVKVLRLVILKTVARAIKAVASATRTVVATAHHVAPVTVLPSAAIAVGTQAATAGLVTTVKQLAA